MNKKRGCLLLLAALVVIVLGLVVLLGIVLLWPSAPQPIVLIRSPQNGARVAVGQETVIQATARGEQNIKRVELWVDGRLVNAQSSSLPGGSSPFPIVTNWRPPTPGAHSVVVRAFNVQGKQGQASISVEAVQSGDRDHDNVPDALDGCPDQPGLTTNNGCPLPTPGDRDGDGVPDGSDVCADQPGTLLARGCPDADGDGVGDGTDACPREPGTAERNGCPTPGDADSDGVPDVGDACPREAGRAETSGCPDRDGDGIRDGDDACPDAAGPSATRGCPDADGDGVYDAIDLCPTVAGPATNSGCPLTGSRDSDGDGVDDSTDLRATEPGTAEGGGAPPPGGGADGDGDGSPDAEEAADELGDELFSDLLWPAYRMTTVEVQALEFQVSHDYSQVYCYASLAGRAEERIGPFAPLGGRRWDIAAMMGPLNSRTIFVAEGLPIEMRVECSGIVTGSRAEPAPGGGFGEAGGDDAYFDLGSVSRSHLVAHTMTTEETVDSGGGSGGRSFRVKYRVCSPACSPAALPAPSIRLTHPSGMHFLWWDWSGQSYDINGFKVYMNGNYMFSQGPRDTFYRFSGVPPCGQTFNIQLTAYRGNPSHPDAESPRSNIQTWEGGLCERTVTVSFDTFIGSGDVRLSDNDDIGDVGPLFGWFQVGDNRESFESHYRLDLRQGGHDISAFFPRNVFTVDLGPEDSLYIGALIRDRDPGDNPNDTLFNASVTIPPNEIRTRFCGIAEYRGNTVNTYITVTPRH